MICPLRAFRALRWINTLPDHGLLPSGATTNGNSWHIADVRFAAPEGLLTNGLPTLSAEGLFSGRKPTMF